VLQTGGPIALQVHETALVIMHSWALVLAFKRSYSQSPGLVVCMLKGRDFRRLKREQ
jgi:hypothetical protein